MPLSALIADDEPLARQRLADLLGAEENLKVVAVCADGAEAVTAIRELSPDVAFLDVRMPELDGFGVIEEVGADRMPAVVFVTAYDEHALRAFEVHAIDYLLKPFDRERFRDALERVRTQLEHNTIDQLRRQLANLLAATRSEQRRPERLVVKTAGRVHFLKIDELDWIDAAGNYVRLNAHGKSHLLRETMAGIEDRLDPQRFVRIHRSAIVNLDRVKELVPGVHGDYEVVLLTGARLPLSRSCRERLEAALGATL
ncbi:MAG TPA: LytTR family DNA-binding domain-containing protein [Thermoanaerobaculia bacterium]|nr:LytTR family DNA-binding domain-containing protein [Thermoanaerobaculia bacterium]